MDMTFGGRGMQTVMSPPVLFKSGVNKTSKTLKNNGDVDADDEMKCNCHSSVCAEGGGTRGTTTMSLDARKNPTKICKYIQLLTDSPATVPYTAKPSRRVCFSLPDSRTSFSVCLTPPPRQIFLSNPFWGAGLRVLAGQGVENRSNHLFID